MMKFNQKSLQLSTKLTLLVVILSCQTKSLEAFKEIPKELTKECDNVIEMLELFALGKIGSSKSSITIESLRAAYSESLSWSYQDSDNIKQQKPLVHLLTHLLVTMESYLNETMKRDDILPHLINKDYINRVMNLYKLLRQTYLQKNAGLMGKAPETDRIDDLIDGLMMSDNSDPYEGSQTPIELNQELFNSAQEQYNSFLKQLNALPAEPKNIQMIQGLLNVLNQDETQILARWIFPQLKGKTILSKAEMDDLKYTFETELNSSGFKIVNGMKINSLTNLPPPT